MVLKSSVKFSLKSHPLRVTLYLLSSDHNTVSKYKKISKLMQINRYYENNISEETNNSVYY